MLLSVSKGSFANPLLSVFLALQCEIRRFQWPSLAVRAWVMGGAKCGELHRHGLPDCGINSVHGGFMTSI